MGMPLFHKGFVVRHAHDHDVAVGKLEAEADRTSRW